MECTAGVVVNRVDSTDDVGRLPNITGAIRSMGLINTGVDIEGAISRGGSVSWNISGKNTQSNEFVLDASLANALYGNSTKVQPPSVLILPCIKI